MDDVIYFTADKNKTAQQNLDEFIIFSKRLNELNQDINFDDNYWKDEVNFVKIGISSKNKDEENLLDNSIREFAKAYVKYQRIARALKTQETITAIRVIEQTCLQRYNIIDITKLKITDFDLAAEQAREHYKGSAYAVGRHLKILLDFLKQLHILELPNWKSPIKKPSEKSHLLNKESEEYRASKLPDENAIFALADIFARKESELSDRDIFVTCAVSLLLAAPERASELFFLKNNCLYEEEMAISDDKAELILTNSDTQKVYGIRWYAQKRYGYDLKFIPNIMVSTVQVAIERLQRLSEKARQFATLLEMSEKFPRHELCPDVTDDQLLTFNQVLSAMGFDLSMYENQHQAKSSGKNFLKSRDIPIKDYSVCLNDLNVIVRKRLPKGFPYIPFKTGGGIKVKWSEALFSSFSNQFHSEKITVFTELWMPHIDTLNEDLSPTRKKLRGKDELSNVKSIFQRWEYGDYSVSSHQFRHLLNTIANTNGMDSILLAKWSGRADIKQNRVYDHTSVQERNYALIEMQKNEISLSKEKSTYQFQVATPRTLQELNTRTALAMHTTEFGLCTHSYIDEPCLKYRNCLNCTEHVCIKGDKEKTKRLQDRLKKEKILWQKDKLAVDKNVTGAKVWFETRELTIKRCEQMLALLNDPNIDDGTPLSLPATEEISHLDLAYQKAGRKKIPVIENLQREKAEEIASKTDHMITNLWI